MLVSYIVFPGSNCDHDIEHAYSNVIKTDVKRVWHRDTDIGSPDLVVLPGGFSYGDYLRCGALAKLSPIMKSVVEFANGGGPVLGICNGFQILCEVGLLPGVLLQNTKMKFLSRFEHYKVESSNTPFTKSFSKGEVVRTPVAHFEGNYYIDSAGLERIQGNDQVVFRYCNENGERTGALNGAVDDIAGVCNSERNVLGMMPHPERVCDESVAGVGTLSAIELLNVA